MEVGGGVGRVGSDLRWTKEIRYHLLGGLVGMPSVIRSQGGKFWIN